MEVSSSSSNPASGSLVAQLSSQARQTRDEQEAQLQQALQSQGSQQTQSNDRAQDVQRVQRAQQVERNRELVSQQASEADRQRAEQSRPTVNTSGQVVGTRVNTTA